MPSHSQRPQTGKHIGLIGCGRWGRHILRDLLSLGSTVTVVARSHESRQRATEDGATAAVGGIEDVPPADGYVVATPTITHAEVVRDLLDRDAPIFVEKPLTSDPHSAAELVELAADRVFVMDKWRYHPGVELLRDIARSGELGEIVGLRTTRTGWGNPHSDVDCTWILAPHDLSVGLEVLGSIPPARSAAAAYDDGAVVQMIGLLGDSPWLALEVAANAPAYRREIALICREGTAVLAGGYDDRVAVARYGEDAEQIERRPISAELPLLRELRAFLEHLEGGPPPRSSASEGSEIVARIADLRAMTRVHV